MARNELTATQLTDAGVNDATGTAGTDTNTFKMQNDGRNFLRVKNANAATRAVTIQTPVTHGGKAVAESTYVIPGSATAGGVMWIGPFPPEIYNQQGSTDPNMVYIDPDAAFETDLTFTAFHL